MRTKVVHNNYMIRKLIINKKNVLNDKKEFKGSEIYQRSRDGY